VTKKSFWKRTGRVIAGAEVLWNLNSVTKPPEMTLDSQTQQLQSQWAKNQKANVLPTRQLQARELGYQLREPVSADHRSQDESHSRERHASDPTPRRERDGHDQALSERPARGHSSDAKGRNDRTR
jgi:hypothetical protein